MEKYIKIGSDCSGIGSMIEALKRTGVDYKEIFSCDFDYYARITYLHNHGTTEDVKLAESKQHKKYCEGVKKIVLLDKKPSVKEQEFLDEANEFAKKFSFYYPFNMYEREIPKDSMDVYMGSFPCQSFSLAGKRKGERDKRGVLFYSGHEFIQKNRPRYFIFENVKGLLSDDNGKTFQRWLDYLGGKSVNGNPLIFPHPESVPYHIYWQVLNAKDYGVPQNRERVFIIGIRDDQDNDFAFPKPFHLTKRLKDVLEENVDEKYYLSDKMVSYLNGAKRSLEFTDPNEKQISNCVLANQHKMSTDQEYFKVKSATSKGYETAQEGDSINFSQPNSETRRGRVGKEVAQTLDTSCNQGVLIAHVSRSEEGKKIRKQSMANGKDFTPFQAKQIEFKESDVMNCVTTATTKDNLLAIGAIRGRGKNNEQQLEINETGNSNSLTTVQKDNVVIESGIIKPLYHWGKGKANERVVYDKDGISPCLPAAMGMGGGYTPSIEEHKENNLFNTNKNSNFNGNLNKHERNTIEALSLLQKEIGTQEIEAWGLRILETIREKEILWEKLHEKSVSGKAEKRDYINSLEQGKSTRIIAQIIMRSLPKETWERCSPQGRKSIKQLIRQLNEGLSELSFKNTQTETNLQSGELQIKNNGWFRVLQQALFKIQEIWQSTNVQTQSIQPNYRIRRLTEREVLRLMDFPDSFKIVCSPTQTYKQAGNSIVVNVLCELIKKLNL